MDKRFSVLIPIYMGNNVLQVRRAVGSIIDQTLTPDEILIILDGKIEKDVYAFLNESKRKYSNLIKIVELGKHYGLGEVLNKGINLCKYNIIARMDADDFSVKERFKIQIDVLCNDKYDIVGSNIAEFYSSMDNISNIRRVPKEYNKIVKFSKKRNPMNHMTVMFRREKVTSAGNYSSIEGFEDYDLWMRMLDKGYKFYNIAKCLVLVQAGYKMYERRGGIKYIRNEFIFEKKLLNSKSISLLQFIYNIASRSIVRILPNKIRKFIYVKFLRNKKIK